jgi:hypothetical protein
MQYNWKLYDDFLAAAEECGITISSQDGGCLHLDLPKEIKANNFAMLWTPLNKTQYLGERNDADWRDKLREFKQNSSDFHLEFCAYGDGHYYMFPEVNLKNTQDITRQDIVDCIKRMLDPIEYEKMRVLAIIREMSEDSEA